MLPSLDREKTLDELAMDYAIISSGVGDPSGPLASKKITISQELWEAGHLRHQMEVKFGCFETQEAIKRATAIVKMVIPDQGDDDG